MFEATTAQFDTNAFYPVLASFIAACLAYLLFSTFSLLNASPISKLQRSQNCNCRFCLHKLSLLKKKEEKKSSALAKKNISLILLLLILFFLCQQKILSVNQSIKVFDPYEILNISYEDAANFSVVKKAYKKLALQYHPDKNRNNLQAKAKFILISKAYETLTDSSAMKNYMLYGNPDGVSSMRVSIGMPQFVLDKKNHPYILSLLIFSLALACYYFLSWVKRQNSLDDDGIHFSTKQVFFTASDSNSKLTEIPFFLGLASEFYDIPVRRADTQKIDDCFNKYSSNFPNKNFGKISYNCKKAISILYSYFFGDSIDESCEEYLKIFSKLIDVFFLVQTEKFFLYEYELKGECVYDDVRPVRKEFVYDVLIFQQLFFQGIPFGEIKGVSEDLFGYCQLGVELPPKLVPFRDFLALKEKEKKELIVEDQDNVIKIANSLPVYKYETKAFVEGFPEFVKGDYITFQIKIVRQNVEEGKSIGVVHSLKYPFLANECIEMCIENSGVLFHESKIQILEKETMYSFRTKVANEGMLKMKFILFPTCYFGIIDTIEFSIGVKGHSEKRARVLNQLKSIDLDEE